MATLTETAYYTRKVVNYGIIGILVILILKITWNTVSDYWRATHPPPPPPPNVLYGKLPYPIFPKERKIEGLSFKLETVTGDFPQSSPSAKVYFMPTYLANLLSFERASEKAKLMGFSQDPISLSSEEYLWSDPQIPLRTLKINIVTGNLSLRYDFRLDQILLQEKNLLTEDQAVVEAKNILSDHGLLPDDIENGETLIEKLKFQGGMLVNVGSVSEADFVRVKFLRSPLENIPIVTPADLAVAFVTLSGSQDSVRRVVEIDFNYQMTDRENFATYPLTKPSLAWEQLKVGTAYIADIGEVSTKEKVIRDIYLSYYDSLQPQTYLEPVYVFEGDKGFKAYFPAIDEKWLESPPK